MTNHNQQIADALSGIDREKTYKSIGRFIFEFSQLEYEMKYLLCLMTRVDDEYFNAMVSPFDFARLCHSFSSVSKVCFAGKPNVAAKIESLVKECLELNNDRVRVVHALWVVGGKNARAIHLSRQSLKTSVYYDRDGELESKADRARSLKNDISEVAQNGMFNPSL